MESLRDKIKELEELEGTDPMTDVGLENIREDALSIIDKIERIVNDAEELIDSLDTSEFIDVADIQERIKEVSKSLY